MKKGISLVALVITIIVLIILTAAVILTATNSNIFGKSEEAVFKSDISGFQEELTKSILEEQLKDNTLNPSTINASTNADVAKWIPSIVGTKYEGKIEIANGKLVYVPASETEKEIEWSQSIGIGRKQEGSNGAIEYSQGETLPRMTLNSSITAKEWSNLPRYGSKSVKLSLNLIKSGSEKWHVIYDGGHIAVFNDSETKFYDYYWDASQSHTSNIGWEFCDDTWQYEVPSELLVLEAGYTVELNSDVPSEGIEQWYTELNTWFGDVFVVAE